MIQMTVHTTNYFNTFIEVADDCPANQGVSPNSKGDNKTIAELQFELIQENPYTFTSDDILFQVFADRNDLIADEYPTARAQFFSKGQPCFRASPLTKRYGFGIHADNEGKVAIYGCETEAYDKFLRDPSVKKVKAMRSAKKPAKD